MTSMAPNDLKRRQMTSKTQKPQIASKGSSITSNIPECGLDVVTLGNPVCSRPYRKGSISMGHSRYRKGAAILVMIYVQ